MKAEQAKKLADQALKDLTAALEQGQSDSLAAYLAMMGRFHDYSFGNILLIMSQNPDATKVAGFHAWRKLGRFVKKGEKGIVIIAPMLIKKDAQQAGEGDDTILRFRAVYVFDVSQTDGEPLPEFARVGGNPNGYTERLKTLVAEQGVMLEYEETLGGADGISKGGTIVLREGLSPAEEFSVLTHELAHEMLHKNKGEARPSKSICETEAEAVAFVVSNAIGLDASTAAADYIQLYAGDNDTLAASLNRIQKASTAIIQAISESPDSR